MKVIYTAGPINAESIDGRWENIMRARTAAKELWAAGFAVICPHMNTMFMDGFSGLTHDDWLAGDLEILARCDGIFMLPGWPDSPGACREHGFALRASIPIFYSVTEVEQHFDKQEVS